MKLLERQPLNMLSGDKFAERSLFDEKVAASSAYQYDGTKGGVAWKMKVRGYFISKAPARMNILEWAGCMEQGVITVDMFRRAVGTRLKHEEVDHVNSSLWAGSVE